MTKRIIWEDYLAGFGSASYPGSQWVHQEPGYEANFVYIHPGSRWVHQEPGYEASFVYIHPGSQWVHQEPGYEANFVYIHPGSSSSVHAEEPGYETRKG